MKKIFLFALLVMSVVTASAETWTMLITCNGKTIEATMYDNATTRAIRERLPLKLDMLDLYGREMTYRFTDALPTDDVNDCGFEKGEIVYYPPMHSFVIMYAKDDEQFEMQKLGYITNTSDVDVMNGIGDTEMTFTEKGNNNMQTKITIGSATFTADIEDTETGRAFMNILPMTLDMTELNGNEKYHYLLNDLPNNDQYFSSLSAGDLMLYSGSCVVLFYGNAGGYNYTRIGKLTSTEGLANAVGKGNVSVKFEQSTSAVNSVKADIADHADGIYDLYGRRLSDSPNHGIYIENGIKKAK